MAPNGDNMNGIERLKRLAERVSVLYESEISDISRDELDRMANEIAVYGEVALATTTGFALRIIKNKSQ